jgi:hypothetical protein
MSLPKSFMLAAVAVLALSTFAFAAPRPRYGNAASYGAYGAQGAYDTRASGGGYSSDPKTRELEALADKYKPGW